VKIKKDLKRFFNGAALKEKDILLQAAGVSTHKPKTHSRAKLAVAALSVVALVLAAALLIGNMASSAPKNISPDNPSVLNSSLSQDNVLVNSTVTEENEELNINLPIVSCGRYTSGFLDGGVWVGGFPGESYCGALPGEVSVETMSGTQKQMDELQEDVLYAVCFAVDFSHSTKYKKAIEYIEYSFGQISGNYEKEELYRSANKSFTSKMYKYFEDVGIEFYDKTVYLCDFTSDGEIESIYSEELYRVAFLTKEQIKALKGGEDYGIRVKIVFDEMAKPDNEPVYLRPWAIAS